jgi:transcriptional regulator with XRE-family HTH domain
MALGASSTMYCLERRKLAKELADTSYRWAFVETNVRDTIAFQLRAMREDRAWNQGRVAFKAFGDAKLQSMISKYENPDYGKYSLSTLIRLAKVFDVALVVRFASFSELVDWDLRKSATTLNPPSFENDKSLSRKSLSRPSNAEFTEAPTDQFPSPGPLIIGNSVQPDFQRSVTGSTSALISNLIEGGA